MVNYIPNDSCVSDSGLDPNPKFLRTEDIDLSQFDKLICSGHPLPDCSTWKTDPTR